MCVHFQRKQELIFVCVLQRLHRTLHRGINYYLYFKDRTGTLHGATRLHNDSWIVRLQPKGQLDEDSVFVKTVGTVHKYNILL